MKEEKYLVYGGYVMSRSDDDRHFITAKRVVELYGVNPKNCICFKDLDAIRPDIMSRMWRDYKVLKPDSTGKYKL